ncbi:MAG: HD-GYP domain-containing protein [Armatimonadetes bacterium]|nr:HD-GYP domain-containing protein [Armatimonadota bacterium]
MHRPLSSTDRVFGDCLDYLSRLLAPWEPYTLYHCKRVSATAALLAMHLGLCEREVKAVQVAGYLHDIGKVGISREVLNRPAKLDAVTYEEVKKHPEIGARILSAVPWPWDLVPAVRYHHEKWDGSGYPVGLKGNQIPLSAQIVSIADFFDSLTTNRPFRAALCPRTALSMMQGLVGRSFCPELWSMFEAMIEDLIRAVPPADPVNRVDKVEYPDSGAWNVL